MKGKFQSVLLAALVFPAFGAQQGALLTVLHSFHVSPNGENPWAALVQGTDGYFYGTTAGGGTNGGFGTIFSISSNGSITSLYSFSGGNDGRGPAGVVQGSDGYFYGTTEGGGTNGGYGTVFRISTNGVLTGLYSFSGGNNGAGPAGVVQGSDGYFYGTTPGGAYADQSGHVLGTVFKISANGAFTALYSFTRGIDGANPSALVQGSDGYFYGTTSAGGPYVNPYGYEMGTVFKISTNGAFTSLHAFTGGNDGGGPAAGLVQGSDGYFYGTCERGGTSGGYGTVFRISTNGVLTSLYSFTGGTDGADPRAALVQGSDGNFYGTTYSRGTNDGGTAFRMGPSGGVISLFSFGSSDGVYPIAELVQGSDGYFYGTTSQGGGAAYAGTVFKISPHDGDLTNLYSFNGLDGAGPRGALVQGTDGYFYGTCNGGGTSGGYGTVFRISTNGVLTTLYSFTGGSDGAYPRAALVQGSDGYFYGTTSEGGGTNGGYGTVFRISVNGVLTSLHSFAYSDDVRPSGALVQGSDGNFYGTTYGNFVEGSSFGTVFRISTNGVLTSLHSFTAADREPSGALVLGSDGYFYGTTSWTVFRMSTNGVLTTLYSFTGRNGDGSSPQPSGLVQGSDGYFYGTTSDDGQDNSGTVFRLAVLPTFQAVTLTNGTLSLTWSTEVGGKYQWQYLTDLNSTNWINQGNAVTAVGGTLTASDSVTNGSQRFYRVVLMQ